MVTVEFVVQVLMQYISTLFDLSINLNTSIPVHVWQRAARAMFQVRTCYTRDS